MNLIVVLIGAILITNGVPHFVKGITGQRHMTPFSVRSSPVVNVIWGMLNIGPGLWLVHRAGAFNRAVIVTAALGVIVTAVALAWFWSRDDRRLPWHGPSDGSSDSRPA